MTIILELSFVLMCASQVVRNILSIIGMCRTATPQQAYTETDEYIPNVIKRIETKPTKPEPEARYDYSAPAFDLETTRSAFNDINSGRL